MQKGHERHGDVSEHRHPGPPGGTFIASGKANRDEYRKRRSLHPRLLIVRLV
jgi:hypothetical protein